MRKTIFLVLFLALFFSGCSLNVKNDNSAILEQKVYNNLSEWLSSGEEVVCAVDLIDRRALARAKNSKVRLDNISVYANKFDEKSLAQGFLLSIEDNWLYMWSGRNGLKLNIKKYKEEASYPEDTAISSWQDIVNPWIEAGFIYKCERTRMSDSLFIPPNDVVFEEIY